MIRVRFAPSPTGHLHLGSARTALFNWLFARHQKGTFVVRIEDTDRTRSTEFYEKSILEDLSWLGLVWDEGPEIGGSYGPYHQSKRQEIYEKYARELLAKGRAYWCYCTPEELEAERERALSQGRMPKYNGRCLRLSEKEKKEFEAQRRKKALRFQVQQDKPFQIEFNDLIRGKTIFSSEVIGDFIILRADGRPTYNFAVVVDDFSMKITHVLRGEDHLTNTAAQIALFEALREKPPQFGHLSMIVGPDRTKLSKRHGATSISQYRKQGYLPEALTNYLALLSWSSKSGNEFFSLEDLTREFSLERVSKSSAIFDLSKLNWLNGLWIRALAHETLTDRVIPYLVEEGFVEKPISEEKKLWLIRMVEAVRGNLTTLADITKYSKIFFKKEIKYEKSAKEILKTTESKFILKLLLEMIKTESPEAISDPIRENIYKPDKPDIIKCQEILNEVAATMKEKSFSRKKVFSTIRLALTGESSGPELFYIINLYGKQKTEEILKNASL